MSIAADDLLTVVRVFETLRSPWYDSLVLKTGRTSEADKVDGTGLGASQRRD